METIKLRHCISLGLLFSVGNCIITLGVNNENLIFSIILSSLISFVFLFFYQRLLEKYPMKNIFEIITLKCNNIFGKVLISFYLLLLIICGVQIIYLFIDFITTINQSDFLSKNIIMFMNFLLLGYVLKNSLINICRFSQVICVITIVMIVLLFIFGIKDMNFKNLLPFFPLANNFHFKSFFSILINPFLEMTFLFNIFCKLKDSKIKRNIYFIIIGINMLFLILIGLQTVSLIGKEYVKFLNFPYYVCISCINMSKIVIRIESLSLIIIYFCCFMKVVLIVYNIILGIKTLLNTKKEYYYPILLLLHILSLVMFDNVNEYLDFYFYYVVLYLLVNFLVLLVINFKNNKNIIKHNT